VRVVILGAGGHARSVIGALRSRPGDLEPVACTDPDPSRTGAELDGVPIVGGDEKLAELIAQGVPGACLGLGGIGDNRPRQRLFEQARSAGFTLPTVVHAAAQVADAARLAAGAQILVGAIVGPGAEIGENAIVNSGAIVEHDCRIAAHVHLATGCALAGGVVVSDRAHVGIGAIVLQGCTIGAGAIVGAGAVVTRDVSPGAVVVGCPARAAERG
jgi:UDP-perosamine 4-acetyltransferase